MAAFVFRVFHLRAKFKCITSFETSVKPEKFYGQITWEAKWYVSLSRVTLYSSWHSMLLPKFWGSKNMIQQLFFEINHSAQL